MDVASRGDPCTLKRCADLDLTPFSGLQESFGLENNTEDPEDSQHLDISVTSSVKDLIQFEILENAAETHESFVSTVSYAQRLWTSQPFSLMPPSSFEEASEEPSENENDLSAQTLDESEETDRSAFDHPNEASNGDQSIKSLFDLIDGTEPAKSDDHNTVTDSNAVFDPETEDSDDDTRSLASISLFHESIPVIMSTPSTKNKKTTKNSPSAKNCSSAKKEGGASPSPLLVKKLFPSTEQTTSPDSTSQNNTSMVKNVRGNARMQTARQINVGEGVILKEMQDKLQELKSQIVKFKSETAKLTKSRLECDAATKQLAKDRERFNIESDTKLLQIEEIHRSEMKKLEMEKKILYKHAAMQKQDETRRLVEANQDLTTELEGLREEVKKSEGRHQSSLLRLRERIKSLEKENDLLKDKTDALTEDKQELIREVVRLSKRGSGGASLKEERKVHSLNAATESSPRRDAPFPSDDKAVSLSPTSSPSSARPILKAPEKISPPKNVHFDPQSVNQLSFNEESFAEEKIEPNGTIEQTFKNGRKVRIYKNGTKKEVSKDGKCSTTTYFNGDVRQVLPNKEVYFYAGNQTVHTIYPNGTQVFQFANGQTEKIHADGSKEIQYPSLMVKTLHVNGDEESKYPDGNTEHWNAKTKTRTVMFANGEEEIHTETFKKRIFPDGTQKVLFPDGRSETRYSNGRIRIKDPTGKLVFDTEGGSSAVHPSTGQGVTPLPALKAKG